MFGRKKGDFWIIVGLVSYVILSILGSFMFIRNFLVYIMKKLDIFV